MTRQRKYRFYEKPHSKGGKLSSLLALFSVACLIVCVVISYAMRGSAGIAIGGIGLIAIFLSIYGFFVGMRSFKEPEVSYSFSILGSIARGVMSAAWLILFLAGIS